jgi:hypothetical protein
MYLTFRYLKNGYSVLGFTCTGADYDQSYLLPGIRVYVARLKTCRIKAGLTQAQCTEALGRPQSFMSDVERGSRRLDLVQLRALLDVLRTDLIQFVARYEALCLKIEDN